MEAGIERNADADGSVVGHSHQSTGRAPVLQRVKGPHLGRAKAISAIGEIPGTSRMIEAVLPPSVGGTCPAAWMVIGQ